MVLQLTLSVKESSFNGDNSVLVLGRKPSTTDELTVKEVGTVPINTGTYVIFSGGFSFISKQAYTMDEDEI